MLLDVMLISADALGHSHKPRPDGGIIDATLFQLVLQEIEGFTTKAIEKHTHEDVADIVIPAEVVNEIVAE